MILYHIINSSRHVVSYTPITERKVLVMRTFLILIILRRCWQ